MTAKCTWNPKAEPLLVSGSQVVIRSAAGERCFRVERASDIHTLMRPPPDEASPSEHTQTQIKTPTEDDIVTLCRKHDPVAIIVRYSKVGAAAMDAAPSLKVISKHGSGTDTIDKADTRTRQMRRALKVVEALPDGQAQAVLPLSDEGGDDADA